MSSAIKKELDEVEQLIIQGKYTEARKSIKYLGRIRERKETISRSFKTPYIKRRNGKSFKRNCS